MPRNDGLQEQMAWELWYRDTFDRDCPPAFDTRGTGLTAGLAELWARHLFETVQPDGAQGFSRFSLRWKSGQAEITGSSAGGKRLRGWLFGGRRDSVRGYVEEANAMLLATLAVAHARRIDRPDAAAEILALAEESADAEDFARRL
jgi:hypothetical protein